MTTRCPSCFRHLPDDSYLWVCRSGKCPPTLDAVAKKFTGKDVGNGPFVVQEKPQAAPRNWAPVRPVECPQCHEPAQEACPHCHYGLLDGWRSASATCIAMNGARATGKSLYIAVLVKLLGQLLATVNSTIHFADSRTQQAYKEVYEKPLFEARSLMQPTMSASSDGSYQTHPLILSLGVLKGVRRYLVIRDVAGEDMESPPVDTQPLEFLRHADGVFFMFDPLAVSDIRAKVQDLVPTQLRLGGDPNVVLGNLLNIIGTATPPLAVILSKFDAMHELRNVDDVHWQSIMSNSGAAFMRDPSLDHASYDHADGELLHEEVRSLLHRLNANHLVLSLEQPNSGHKIPYRYFAVSALGESPRGETVNARGIAPFRCVDPVKWILSLNGVI